MDDDLIVLKEYNFIKSDINKNYNTVILRETIMRVLQQLSLNPLLAVAEISPVAAKPVNLAAQKSYDKVVKKLQAMLDKHIAKREQREIELQGSKSL